MEKNKHCHGFPWMLVAFLCLYISLTALAVPALFSKEDPPKEPTQTTMPTQPIVPAPVEPDCQGVFDRMFAQPDYASLYRLAGEGASRFEGADDYAAYMQTKVGHRPLTYQEVQTDLADTHRYLVYSGEEKIAAFTMTGGPDWQMDRLELYYEPEIRVTVEALAEHTVYVNGVALDEGDTIRTLHTLAEDYLPQGVHGHRRKWQMVDGLLTEPEVKVLDTQGNPVPMERDSETGVYHPLEMTAAEMTEAEAALARKAAMTDAQYAIGAVSNTQLKEYFDSNSALYKMLVTNPRNLQKYTSSSIDEKTIELSDFTRYGDTMFSVNVKLTQKIIRAVGTLKVYHLDKTYFFTLKDGKYLVTDYTNQQVTQQVQQVRLTFVNRQEQNCVMVNVNAHEVEIPCVEDVNFLGWATRSDAENGTVHMQIRILPDGTVLGELEPMMLYPVFQTP